MRSSQGFWRNLIGSTVYSTDRGKWFYSKAELIVNILICIFLVIGLLYTIYTFILFEFHIFGIIWHLWEVGKALLLLFITLIFFKLNLMAVGALIYIGELTAQGLTFNTQTYRYQPSAPPIAAKNNVSRSSEDKQINQLNDIDNIHKKQRVEPVFDTVPVEFESKRVDAIKRITAAGHFVNASGEYPNIKWEINFSNGRTKKYIYSIDDLVDESMKYVS